MKVYCEDCKYTYRNRINPESLCCNPEFEVPRKFAGTYFTKPRSWMDSVLCKDFNAKNDCKGFIHRSLLKRWLRR